MWKVFLQGNNLITAGEALSLKRHEVAVGTAREKHVMES